MDEPPGGIFPPSRSPTTQKNNGRNKFRLMVPRTDTMGTRISTKDVLRARRLRTTIVRANAKHNTGVPPWKRRVANLIRSNRALSANLPERAPQGIVVDSGATLTLLKKNKWLGKITNRLNAVVRTATGEKTMTEGHGALEIITQDRGGQLTKLQDIGQGHILRDITFPLLSVSQMNDHGCSVVFKPKEAFMITPGGTQIPFKRDNGLFFLPTPKDQKRGDAIRGAVTSKPFARIRPGEPGAHPDHNPGHNPGRNPGQRLQLRVDNAPNTYDTDMHTCTVTEENRRHGSIAKHRHA